jgi:hypothetical protein
MQSMLKPRWLTMPTGRAGHRFQDRYAEAKKARAHAGWGHRGRRFLLLFVALGSMIIGAFLMFLPGPAVLFYFFGGTLLASESLFMARLMDWAEVRLRSLWKWGERHWAQTPTWGRAAVITLVIYLGLSGAYLSYRLFIR